MINFNGTFKLNTNFTYSDKSLTHRALILAAISSGVSVVHNVSLSQDILTTVRALQSLGARVYFDGNTATVHPICGEHGDMLTIDCGNSGTTARLLAGVVAALGIRAKFVGDSSLMKRPMDRVLEPLMAMGAKFSKCDDCLFVCNGGSLTGTTVVAQYPSAQVKSAVLIAGLFAAGQTTYVEPLLTRNHTENMLAAFGAKIKQSNGAVTVQKSKLKPFEIELPNDPSSAAFGVALALAKGIDATFTNVLLNPTRMGFYRVLQRAGADISYCNVREILGERVGDIVVKKSVLKPLVASEQDVCDGIDEIPLLATLALTVKGQHKFSNVAELRYKECNRIQAIASIAEACCQSAIFDGKDLTIISNGELPKGKYFLSYGDHRIAMCQAVLSIIVGGGSVDNAPFEISFPQFLYMLGVTPLRLGLIGEKVSDSASPRLMAHLASRAGICCSYDTVSLPRDLPDDQLLKVIDSFDGLNVTMPFKNRVATLLRAECPSVNTVGRTVLPQSTDGYGIMQSLCSHRINIRNKPVWIVGAGGAAEACVRELLQYGCTIQIVNRTESHAKELSARYSLQDVIDNPVGVLSFVPECDYEQNLTLPKRCQFVLIADYKGYSGLRKQAAKRCLTVIDGLEMLYHQGAKSFALWTDTQIQSSYKDFLQDISQG